MQLGVFAKTFVRSTLDETLDAVCSHRLSCVQFNLSCAGLPTLPDELSAVEARRIGRAAAARGIHLAAVSGTFNMIHPDQDQRRAGLRRLAVLVGACRALGTSLVTLCTGTRDRDDMWRRHPDNDGAAAWHDLVESLGQAIAIAEQHDVTLGIEPEVSNVIDSARKARSLLDELASPRLRIIIDAANLFHAGELPRMRQVLDEAIDLLGSDIVLAHAKDLAHDGAAGDRPAGTGRLDYDHYLRLLRRVAYDGPLILHGLSEAQVPAAVVFLQSKLTELDHLV